MTPEFLEVPCQETDHAEDVAASQLDGGLGAVFDEGSFLAEMASVVLESSGVGEGRRSDDFAYDLGAVVRRHSDLNQLFSIGGMWSRYRRFPVGWLLSLQVVLSAAKVSIPRDEAARRRAAFNNAL